MDCAKIENGTIIYIAYFDPEQGCTKKYLKENNFIEVTGLPVQRGDTYDSQKNRFYRDNNPIYSKEEELEIAINILLNGKEEI